VQDYVCYAACRNEIFAFDLRNGGVLVKEPAASLQCNEDEVSSLEFSRNGKFLAIADDEGDLVVMKNKHTDLEGLTLEELGEELSEFDVEDDEIDKLSKPECLALLRGIWGTPPPSLLLLPSVAKQKSERSEGRREGRKEGSEGRM
jgi:hypothetical protein